jgi:protein-S-isoprenylcysteine O-methyltransferase Ste14
MTDASSRPSTIPWPPLLLLAAVIAASLVGRRWPLTWPGLDDTAARIVGLGIGIGGIVLAIWSIWTLYRARTTVRPDRGASSLVTWGPYRRLRNPIYVADVMLLLGAAEVTKNIWFAILAVGFVGAVTWLAILPEERHLKARFGAAWEDYAARSRRWI